MVNNTPTAGTPASRSPKPWDQPHSNEEPVRQSWPMTIWQGWQEFANTPPPVPPTPGTPPRSVEERLAYRSAFVTVRTPAIDTLATSVLS
ncbi:hypothetical protein [Streptomyces sp. NPDC088762]|uniref:hypothetical protein n=1 Tax=Streptomyces sp. NPDC088762 TaxID=3365891 RepID=UPI0038211D50